MSIRPGNSRLTAATLALFALAAQTAVAQSDDWDLSFAPYLWATGIDGEATIGSATADLDVNFGDIVDVLDGALLGHFEARKDASGFYGDFIYLATEPDDRVELDTMILEAGYLRGRQGQDGVTGWEVGVRYWDFETTLALPSLPVLNRSESWIDGFIGYRRERAMGEKWRSVVRGNVGAGGSDFSWGLDLTYLYDFNSGDSLAVGLKWLDVEYDKPEGQLFGIDAGFFGATIGYVFD